MCSLSTRELRDKGFERTGRESPVSDDGELWSNGHELVCDETATVIDGRHSDDDKYEGSNKEYTYRNSGRVKLIGGFLGNYDWGHDDDQRFRY